MASDVCSHVKVVVRVRPLNHREKDTSKVVHVVDNHMLIFDPEENQGSTFGTRVPKKGSRKVNKDLKFVFDYVLGEDATQLEVFENTTKGILDGFMNGFNCTVFAYGATGAGKTHTMLGSADDPGVMYRTLKELFKRIDDVKEEKVFKVGCSYLEVYNEEIKDLMSNTGPLALREDELKKVVVQGLSIHGPKSAEDILQALDYGNKKRTQHPTEMNATSSRSHAVLQIYLQQRDTTASLNPKVCVSKMSLIDLAGSERASATQAKGGRREGANINRSLLALVNVINALADPKSKKGHIPYRDSKLTRLLKDSLGGNCRTVMIANVCPSSTMFDSTHNTLKYADRAKQIKSTLKSNVLSLNSHLGQYAVICEKQREEIVKLKQKLKEHEDRKAHLSGPGGSNPSLSQTHAEFKRVSESLQKIFWGRAQIRREQLQLEQQLKENELRQRHSEEANQQALLFCAKEETQKATCKHERRVAALRTQQLHIHQRLADAQKRFDDNDNWLHRVQNEMKLLGQNATPPEVLEKDLHGHRLELQVSDQKQQLAHMIQLAALQDQENTRMKKMVNILLAAQSRHKAMLSEAGLAAEVDALEDHELRGVVWANQEDAGAERRGNAEDGPQRPHAAPHRPHAAGGGLAPVLSFSHLSHYQDSPCSAERNKKRGPHTSAKGPGSLDSLAKRPARRVLSMSLPAAPALAGVPEEGVFPLQSPPQAYDPNLTFEAVHCEVETAANSTVVVPASPCRDSGPCPREKSAQRPGKSGLVEEGPTVALKRARQEPAAARRPLRVQRAAGSNENRPRRVVRSAPEGPGVPDSLAKRPARRVLSASRPPAGSVLARIPEEVFPLQSPPQAFDPNLTFEAVHCEVETAANSTVVVPASCHRSAERPGKSLQIPSLLDMRSTKLHYLAMTSAAQRKRRLNSGLVEEGPTVALKRARQEPAAARRPLRVQRAAASDNNRPRRVVRSASEGNLGTLGPPKSRSIFYKTAQQFNKVTKKM